MLRPRVVEIFFVCVLRQSGGLGVDGRQGLGVIPVNKAWASKLHPFSYLLI